MFRIIGILLLCSLNLNFALAQETTTVAAPTAATDPDKNAPQAPADTGDDTLKKIVITGSYIRRTVDEGATSPVTQIDASSKVAESAGVSAGNLMRDNAIINSGGSSNISFHGQSSANNLVLLNGLRLPKPGGGDSADIDFIPATAVERVEILKDGASALYGSEALAGVVNFITKKEYDGANISVRQTSPQSLLGQETAITATYGKSFNSGNILASVQYRGTQPLYWRDTEYGITDVARRGSDVSSPGNFKQSANPVGANRPAADCPPGNLGAGNVCRYDYYENGLPFQDERDYFNALLSTGWDLGNKVRLEAAVVGTHRRSINKNTPIIMRFEDQSAGGGVNYSIPGATAIANGWDANLGGAPLDPGAAYNVLYSADEELGPRKDVNVLNAGMAQIKIGRESETFDWDFAAGYGITDAKTTTVDGNARKDILYQKMLAGTWNPYLPVGAKNDISDAFVETWNTNFADVTNARAIVSGKVINWGDKSVYAAFGIEEQLQNYRFRGDPLSLQDIPISGSTSNQNGSRDVFSTFLELTQNPIHALQIQLAARFDEYSDFGSTINPKIGLAYKVNETLSVRTSYGTGFKAPDLRSLYQGDLTRPSRLRDEIACQANDPVNCNNLYSTTSYGNQNLDPERGEHYNVGVQFRPKKNWQINVDHWRAEGEDALNAINLGRLTAAEFLYGIGAVNALGVDIIRDPNSNVIQSIRYPVRTNSGTYDVRGIDVEIGFKNQFNPFGLGNVNFGFRFDHSHTLSSGQQPFFFNQYERGLDLQWRNISSFTLSRGNHLASWRLRTFSGGDYDDTRSNTTNPAYGSSPTYTEHDLHYEYYGAWNGVITLGVRNFFGQKLTTEYNRGLTGFNLPISDSALGRVFYAGYSQDF